MSESQEKYKTRMERPKKKKNLKKRNITEVNCCWVGWSELQLNLSSKKSLKKEEI